MSEELYTANWAREIIEDLSKIGAAETDEQVLFILQQLRERLELFLNNFKNLKQKIEFKERFDIAATYTKKIMYSFAKDDMSVQLDVQRNNNEKIALYQQLLQQMTIGYYLVNKIRDTFFEPITYAVAFREAGTVHYVENLEIEDLLKGATFLSNRLNITINNFARLEIDIKNIIGNLKEEQKVKAITDSLYQEIEEYSATHKHTYYTKNGERKTKPFASGYLWEAYRHMKRYSIEMSYENGKSNLHTYYEIARIGQLSYTQGGDVLNEQDKFGTSFALSSMNTIEFTLTDLLMTLAFVKNKQDIADNLQRIFLQDLTEETDEHLKQYINNDVEKLLTILRIK